MNRPDDEIFSDALDLPPAERAGFLDRACAGDPAQRARIEALLASDAAAQDFLARPPVPPRPEVPEEQPGDRVGAYVLQRRIGEGGCGVVYLAEQTGPIRRLVALKIIKLGMDTREVIARFETERQTLAMMDHPGIARVFDAGATATGRPFFVMEFVDGLPITRFCDEHRLSTAQRLELFARVCLAIQHAHQKGVIHRDVKPSNILVALHDGTPLPKVIDFGIAKATQGRLTEHTLITRVDQLVGTPAYMSPEQVEARDGDIDTRSDVYSLGVLLYELLAGRPPYDPQSLLQAGAAEIRRIIREVDPPRPSTRLATLAAADRDTVARLRGDVPPHLTSVLRGDLDWIVMRCLEKDRARRYATAHELADDVRRHLRRETVTARPPDALYRARKFVSRHRLACASATALAVSLLAGTAISLLQADRARRAESLARAERDAARAAQQAEAQARADAQRRQEQAEELLTFMLGDFRTELKKLGKLSLLDAVGAQAMAHFAALDPRDLTDTALTRQAKALTQIGEIRLDQARYADAAQAFETAYARAAALCTRHPRDADMLFERAQAEYWIGFTARRRGNLATTREWLVRYRDSALALAALEGSTYRAQRERISSEHNLAVLDLELGDLARAQAGFLAEQSALSALAATRPDDTDLSAHLADTASRLGRVAEMDGRFADALGHYRRFMAIMDSLTTREPAVAKWQSRSADACGRTATLLAISGYLPQACDLRRRSISIFASLTEQDPKNRQWQIYLLNSQLHLLSLQLDDSPAYDFEQALTGLVEKINALAAAEPSSRPIADLLSSAWRLLARLHHAQSHPGARKAIEQALAISEPQAKELDADLDTLCYAAQAHLLAGRIEQADNRGVEATHHWQRVVALLGQYRDSRDWRVLDPLAQALVLLDDKDSARLLLERLRALGYHPVDARAASTLGLPR